MLKRIFLQKIVTIPVLLMGAALTVLTVPSAASAQTGSPLQSYASKKCMTNGGSTANSHPITQYTCNGTNNQGWYTNPNGDVIKNADSGKCLTNGGATGNGAPITQYTCNGSPNQQWYLVNTGIFSSTYHIQNAAGTLCMTTGGLTGNSTPIVQYACNGSYNQTWYW